jgi:hypothetical protein
MILNSTPFFAQMPTNGDYCNWDWEDQDLDNWKKATPSGWARINPPFLEETPANGELYKVQETDDYTKAKGWELIWAQFGPSDIVNPYFILYNKYRGILRAFFYLESYEAYSHTAATLSYSYSSNKPGVLTAGDEYSIAPDKYLANPALGNNMITVIIPKHGRTSWGVADFPMFLDKNIKNAIYQGATFEITFYGCSSYAIYLEGTESQTDDEQNVQHTVIGNSTMYNSTSQSFEFTGTKLAKQIRSSNELQQYMTTLSDGISVSSSTPNFIKDFKKNVKEGYVNLLLTTIEESGIDSFIPGLKTVLKLFRTYVGALPDASTTSSSGSTIKYINLQGTMTVSSVLQVNTFKIPGAIANSGSKITYYDYSLGLINIKKTPKIMVTKPYQLTSMDPSDYNSYWYHEVMSGYKGRYVKYKFDENIDLDFLSVPGIEILDIEYALICKSIGTGDKKYKVEDKVIATDRVTNIGTGQTVTGEIPNPVYRDLEKRILELHDFGNEIQRYGTPFLEKYQFRGITIEVPEDTEISIGVMIMLKSPVSDIPVIVKTSFLPDVELVNHSYNFIQYSDDLPVFPYTDYYQDDIYIELSSSANSNTYTAGEIVMKNGFTGVPNYHATAVNIYPSNGITTVSNVTYQPTTIKCAVKNSSEIQRDDIEPIETDFLCEIYPNPNDGNFIIKFINFEGKALLSLYNANGALLLSQQTENDITHVNLTNEQPGIYFLKILTDSTVLLKKLVIN